MITSTWSELQKWKTKPEGHGGEAIRWNGSYIGTLVEGFGHAGGSKL